MENIIIWVLIVVLATVILSGAVFEILVFVPLVLLFFAILLKFGCGVKFSAMPKLLLNTLMHPLETGIYPIFRAITLAAVYAGVILFGGIFLPLIFEVLDFMKNGIWKDLTLNNFLVRLDKGFNVNYFDIPSWKGVERILNWLFFEVNATVSIFILFFIYMCCVAVIFKSIDEKTLSKIFEDKKKN